MREPRDRAAAIGAAAVSSTGEMGLPHLQRLSAEDEHILVLEHGRVAGHWCKVVIVDGEVDLARLRATVAAQLPGVPRLRQRLEFLPRALGRPVWIDDSAFDLDWHVTSAGVEPLDDAGLRELVALRMQERLDRARPLWRLEVARLADSRSALLWRVHHCMADGFTAMRIAATCIWCAEPPEQPRPPAMSGGAPARASILAAAALDRGASGVRATGRVLRDAAAVRHWREGLAQARRVVASARRELAPAPIATSFDAPLGRRRAVAWRTLPLAALHDAAKRVGPGVTVNDAVVALIGSGVSGWSRAHGHTDHPLRVRIPVSLHAGAGGGDGNHDSFIDVDVPVDESDVVARVRTVSAQTAARKAAHDAQDVDRLMRAIAALPFGDHLVALSDGPTHFSLCISNVVGPRQPVAVDGLEVIALHSVVEVAEHHDLRASVISCADVLSIALCADGDRIEPEAVMRGVDTAWERLASAALQRPIGGRE